MKWDDSDESLKLPSTRIAKTLRVRLEQELKIAAEVDFLEISELQRAENKQRSEFVPDKVYFKTRRKVVRKVHKECIEYCDWLRRYFWREFRSEEDILPRQWMLNNIAIREMLERKRSRYLIPLFNYLWQRKMDLEKSQHYSDKWDIERHHTKNKDGDETFWYFVLLGEISYAQASKELTMSTSLIQKHLQEFCRLEILRKFGKSDSRGQTIYAIGFYAPFKKNRFRAAPFLKDTKRYRRLLLDFDPYHREKSTKEEMSNI